MRTLEGMDKGGVKVTGARDARSSRRRGGSHRGVRTPTCRQEQLDFSRAYAVDERCPDPAKTATPGALDLAPVGQSENLGILPGGFFATLLETEPTGRPRRGR